MDFSGGCETYIKTLWPVLELFTPGPQGRSGVKGLNPLETPVSRREPCACILVLMYYILPFLYICEQTLFTETYSGRPFWICTVPTGRYNLLPFLGQFVTLLVSARISDVSGFLIHRFCIRKNMSYQRCIIDVSAMYQ